MPKIRNSFKFFGFIFLAFFALALLSPTGGAKADYPNQQTVFFVEPTYDYLGRVNLVSILTLLTDKIYFYVDKDWWDKLPSIEKNDFINLFQQSANRFEKIDYPRLINTFGSEPNPVVGNDTHLTILIHPMAYEVGGYTRVSDLIKRSSFNPRSNEREMIYLNALRLENLSSEKLTSYLDHEFSHLIFLAQKDLKYNIFEDTWLAEARAEYVATLLGYDDDYEQSNLKTRVEDFFNNPSVSFLDWQNSRSNYAAVNLFSQYLVEKYGLKILVDSLKTEKTGIEAINYALKINHYPVDFNQVFNDWLITVLINDCSLGANYCYQKPQLNSFRIYPVGQFFPSLGDGNLSVSYELKPYQGQWFKIVGGKDTLKVNFTTPSDVNFKISYIVVDSQNRKTLKVLPLDLTGKGVIFVPDFNNKNIALYLIIYHTGPSNAPLNPQNLYHYSYNVSTVKNINPEQEAELKRSLELQIEALKKQLLSLQQQLAQNQCPPFKSNLYYGLKNNSEVRCLQMFLKSKYPSLYPSGLITGNYLSLTQLAVRAYQKLKGLPQTGYFGPLTRQIANSEL